MRNKFSVLYIEVLDEKKFYLLLSDHFSLVSNAYLKVDGIRVPFECLPTERGQDLVGNAINFEVGVDGQPLLYFHDSLSEAFADPSLRNTLEEFRAQGALKFECGVFTQSSWNRLLGRRYPGEPA